MAGPPPEPIPPEELPALARGVIARAKFPQLATLDGDQPRVRPVSPVRVDGFTIYVANLRSYGKTREIAANPKVELCYLDDSRGIRHELWLILTIILLGSCTGYWGYKPLRHLRKQSKPLCS